MARQRTITTGELADELGVSNSAILKWTRAGLITPTFTTPGGHHRWDVEKVHAELAAARKRDGDE